MMWAHLTWDRGIKMRGVCWGWGIAGVGNLGDKGSSPYPTSRPQNISVDIEKNSAYPFQTDILD